jgi:hypothetical protein
LGVPAWLVAEPLDDSALEHVTGINLQGLGLMRLHAHSSLDEVAEQWRAADERTLRRLAETPFVLFDCGFSEARHWRGGMPAGSGFFEGAAAQEFARTLAHYAWHLARANPLGATLALGMSADCAALLRNVPLQDVGRLAAVALRLLRLRWYSEPRIWRQLLRVASGGSDEEIEQMRLASVRRLAGEVVALRDRQVHDSATDAAS